MLRLQCKVQHYEWGRIGADSEVARLHALSSGEGFQDLPYAELWMGTHPSGPSSVILEGGGDSNPVLLQQWLDMHPEALGKKVQQRWDGELPFLFKVKIERDVPFPSSLIGRNFSSPSEEMAIHGFAIFASIFWSPQMYCRIAISSLLNSFSPLSLSQMIVQPVCETLNSMKHRPVSLSRYGFFHVRCS
jgi:hypothetical protein